MYEYFAEILRTIDGDTVKARVDLGMYTFTEVSLRFYGINAPELNTAAGQVAAMWVAANLWPGRKIKLTSHGLGKYGRWLSTIYLNPAAGGLWEQGYNPLNHLPYDDQSSDPAAYTINLIDEMLARALGTPQ
ncbi:MAG: hypothetical protein D6816_10890 [Bacteroidetes bacterium]|nr:MAG: hypothetical protein D6816_10890 [Bacteroidota bacterium]